MYNDISYYSLARQENAFHRKEGLFTKFVDNRLCGQELQNKHLRNGNFEKEEEITPISRIVPLNSGVVYHKSDDNFSHSKSNSNIKIKQSIETRTSSPKSSRKLRNISGSKNSNSFGKNKEVTSTPMPKGLVKMNYFAKAQRIIEDHNLYRFRDFIKDDVNTED